MDRGKGGEGSHKDRVIKFPPLPFFEIWAVGYGSVSHPDRGIADCVLCALRPFVRACVCVGVLNVSGACMYVRVTAFIIHAPIIIGSRELSIATIASLICLEGCGWCV